MKNGPIKSEDLRKEEIEQVESMWIKTAQSSVKEAENFAQLQKQLELYVESDSIIRCRARIAIHSGNLRQGSRIHCLEKCCFLKDVNNSAYCSEIWPTN